MNTVYIHTYIFINWVELYLDSDFKLRSAVPNNIEQSDFSVIHDGKASGSLKLAAYLHLMPGFPTASNSGKIDVASVGVCVCVCLCVRAREIAQL
jgi:hypothetical protein